MKFDLPDHAKMRIEQRGIDVDYAKKVIRSPDKQIYQPDGKIKSTKKLENGKTLTIVHIQTSIKKFTIITGYYED